MSITIKNPKNSSLSRQIYVLKEILQLNKTAWRLLEAAEQKIPYDWYLAGGGIYHTIWNYYSGKDIEDNIKDYDLFYYNSSHNEDEQNNLLQELNSVMDEPIVDLTNIANIHIWLKDKMKKDISQYKSIEDNIVSFANTANSIGIRKDKDTLKVFAPFGLHDIFSMEARYLGGIFTREEHLKKCKSWKDRWPTLIIH